MEGREKERKTENERRKKMGKARQGECALRAL
jgi:hypothetical protein